MGSKCFPFIEYGNCRVLAHAPMSVQCFVDVKVSFEKKFDSSEKFHFLVLARNTIMLQHLLFQF